MRSTSEIAAADRKEMITFRIAGQEFCVDIMSVREIRGWTPATPIPRAPGFVRGVMNLRGAVLPVIDLAARLGLANTDPTARHVVIVTRIVDQVVGLLVDAVSDILTIAQDEIQPTPEIASDAARAFLAGLLPRDGRMISLISLDRLVPTEAEPA